VQSVGEQECGPCIILMLWLAAEVSKSPTRNHANDAAGIQSAENAKNLQIALALIPGGVFEEGVVANGVTQELVAVGTQWTKHSLLRLAERGVTPKMAETAIRLGQKFYDPLNKSINYVLPNCFASGKSLLVGTNPLTGQVTTVLRSSKNLINKRFIPIR
jgi:hypothetical protein